jgi:hypothetical protein
MTSKNLQTVNLNIFIFREYNLVDMHEHASLMHAFETKSCFLYSLTY